MINYEIVNSILRNKNYTGTLFQEKKKNKLWVLKTLTM